MAVTVRTDHVMRLVDLPAAMSWEAARATFDVDGAITDWYRANTGHDPALDYLELSAGTWTVNEAWLNANEGERVYLDGGRWHVERVACRGLMRLAAHDVDFFHIWGRGNGSLYGVQSRAVDGNASGCVLNRSTFDGEFLSANGATTNFPDATDPDQVIFRRCQAMRYRAGWYMFRGMTVEECYAHSLYFTTDPETGEPSHNTGASIRGGNCSLRRSLIADGNSAALSFYPELGPYTNVVAADNIFRLNDSDTGMEVIMASDREFSARQDGEVVELTDNLFYRGGNLGPGPGVDGAGVGGGVGSYRDGFTLISGNVDRAGNPVAEAA